MHIKILGSAADGGFPRRNCDCPNCSGLRRRSLKAKPRSQTQIAFSPIPDVWFLVGASPDLRAQLQCAPELNAIAGVFLPNAEVESLMGLLHLRDLPSLFVFATPGVQRMVKGENRIFKVLDQSEAPLQWQPLAVRRRIGCHLSENPGDGPTFFYSANPLGGDFPAYVSDEIRHNCPPEDASVALLLEQANKKVFLAPSLSGRNSEWLKTAASADLALLDAGLPLDGPEGLLSQYPGDSAGRKILIRINHDNPILHEDNEEHRAVLDAGFEIAYDGMEIKL
jgi:pyrroloquinoline quinone biosynthesis protein B